MLAAVRLALVIVTWRRPQLLATTLDTLTRCTTLPEQLIVVDSDEERSAEPVVGRFAEALPDVDVQYVAVAERGTSRQRNTGMAVARGDVVVFADDDVEFDSDVFRALAAAYDEPDVVGATGRVVEAEQRRVGGARTPARRLLGGPEGTMTRFGYPRRITHPFVARDVEFMYGCLMSARLDLGREVGFDERLPGYGLAEDEDFGYRLSRRGRVRYVPDACLLHMRQGFRSANRRDFDKMLVRNRLYLFRKNFRVTPATSLQFAAIIGVLIVHRALNGEWQGVVGLLEGVGKAWRDRYVRT